MTLDIVPVTPERWNDLERLFGPNGAYGNCWCTWFVLTSRGWEDTPPAGRRALLAGLVADGAEPGLLAYRHGDPVGWVAVGPRSRYARMTSPRAIVYRPIDERPSWVINCFFVTSTERRTGVATALLDAAVQYAFDREPRSSRPTRWISIEPRPRPPRSTSGRCGCSSTPVSARSPG